MWMLPANIRTGCSITLFINWLRAFFPALSIPTNIFNPAGWINPLNPDAILNLDPLAVADAGAVRQPVPRSVADQHHRGGVELDSTKPPSTP
jgi:hypothetical protein